MKTTKSICIAFLLCTVAVAFAQTAKSTDSQTIAQVLDKRVSSIESEFVFAADAMPEDKYNFAPTNGEFKGVRNFGQQVKHVAAVNYWFGSIILGEKPPVNIENENGPVAMTSKADIAKFAKDSYVYVHKAVNSLNEKNYLEPIKNPFGEGTTTRLNLAVLLVGHGFDHYGQMVEYLRMNGIVPPASRS